MGRIIGGWSVQRGSGVGRSMAGVVGRGWGLASFQGGVGWGEGQRVISSPVRVGRIGTAQTQGLGEWLSFPSPGNVL